MRFAINGFGRVGRTLLRVYTSREDAREQLDDEDDRCQHTEDVPPVEILGGIILSHVQLHRLRKRETIVNPLHEAALRLAHF